MRCGCRVHVVLGTCCLIRSCGWGQVEPLEVGCPGPVQGLAGVPGVEADAVDGGGSGEVLQAGFVQAGVAGAADAGDVGGLGHGALDAGPGPVAVLEFGGVLGGAGGQDGLVDLAGAQAPLPAGAGRGGGSGPGRAGAGGAGRGLDPDQVDALIPGAGGPPAAGDPPGGGGRAAGPDPG